MEYVAVCRRDSEVLMFEMAQALHEQACADQQHQRKCCLNYDQRLLRQGGMIPRGAIHSMQGFGRIGVGRDPGRHNAEYDSSEQRKNKSEGQHNRRGAGVNGKHGRVREGESQNHPGSRIRHHDAQNSAGTAQQDTFHQHLPDQAGSGRPQRHANRSLRPPRRALSQ